MHKIQHIRTQNFFRLVTEDLLDGRIRVGMISFEIDCPDPFVSCLYDRTELFFTFFECFLSAFAGTSVTRDSLDANRFLVLINQAPAEFERQGPARLCDDLAL